MKRELSQSEKRKLRIQLRNNSVTNPVYYMENILYFAVMGLET